MQLIVEGVRSATASRSATGLLSAYPRLLDYNYTEKFKKVKKGSKGAGHRFEAFVANKLTETYPGFLSGVPFEYKTIYNPRATCIPDGLLVLPRGIVIIEVKLRRSMDAWFQLRHLYGPVVQKAFGIAPRLLTIEKYPDPDVRFPEPVQQVKSFRQFLEGSYPFGALTVWNKKDL